MSTEAREFSLFDDDDDSMNGAIHLRILSTSDVYEFGNWPRVFTALADLKLPPGDGNYNLVLIPGDFLAPSVISCVDQGASMVDCMNNVGFEYCIFGNHETDVKIHALADRIRESNFTWINSNITGLPSFIPELPEYVKLDFESSTQKRSIALLGLLTDDKYLYRADAFGGAKIHPVAATALALHERLAPMVDVVIPLTHQSMAHDRHLALISAGRFPVIIGAHDHSPFTETVGGVPIIKAGMDAINLAVTDIVWSCPDTPKEFPDVSISLVPMKRFEPNPRIEALVKGHQSRVLGTLDAAHVLEILPNVDLTSKNIRVAQRNMGTMITCLLRDSLLGDCCILPSGTVRRGHDYPSDHRSFTYRDLVSELPFEDDVVVLDYPGEVIEAAIKFSRGPLRKGMGGFLQVDMGIVLDEEENIQMINGERFEKNKLYRMVTNILALEGIDDNVPMIKLFNDTRANGGYEGMGPREGDPRRCPLKLALQTVIARRRLVKVWTHRLEQIRSAQDGLKFEFPKGLSKRDFVAHPVNADSPDWFVDQFFIAVDYDADGHIGWIDIAIAFLFTWFAGCVSGVEEDDTYRIDPTGRTTADELQGHLTTVLPPDIVREVMEGVGGKSAMISRADVLSWLDTMKK